MGPIPYLEVESITTADEGVLIRLSQRHQITLIVSDEDRDDLVRALKEKKVQSIKLETPQTRVGSGRAEVTETPYKPSR